MVSETIVGPRGRLKGWFDRGGWIQAWHVVYLATLVVATAVMVTDGDVSATERAGLGGLAALETAWYVAIVRRRYWDAPPGRFAVAMGVAAVLWFPLLVGHPAYGVTIFAAYGVAACPWLRRSIAAVAVLTGMVLVADALDGGDPVTAADVAVVLAIGVLVVLAHATQGAIAAESERRRRLIVDLEATRAELAASERAAGASAERERLAREIHDALAQGFTSIVMLLEAADAKLPAGSAEVRAPLDQALQTARDSLAEARRIVWALGPEASEPGALVTSLERLAERTTAAGGAGVEVVVTGDPVRLDAGRELVLLRTAQEAVGNARRHADASRITVTVSWLGDQVILDVADDGRGFDPDRLPPGGDQGGFGLPNLARRARDAGGQLTVDSTPGRGTTISLTLRLRLEPTDAAVRGGAS
ncbi:MAG: sensor histidine kinase [Acidimicrobiales bacterium]